MAVTHAEVRVLDADPELGAALSADDLPEATRAAVARAYAVDRGPWKPAAPPEPDLTAGLLVLDGLVLRSLAVADRGSTELLGAGDLLRPWQPEIEGGVLAYGATWHVLEPVRVAVLDRRFAAATARWPAIGAAVVGRALRRARWQGVFAALTRMTRVDRRVLLALWHLAERWGRVRPDGLIVRLPLTHEQLGALVGARRPSVTSALSTLAARRLVERRGRSEWLLSSAALDLVAALRQDAAGGAQDALRLAA